MAQTLRLLKRTVGTPVGPALAGVVESDQRSGRHHGICLFEFGSEERQAREIAELEASFGCSFSTESSRDRAHLLDTLESQVAAYFEGHASDFDLPLVTPGTPFQQSIWRAMRDIPLGETRTYGQLAVGLGRSPAAARAIGAASGRNRVSLLIPCHRVVDSGYDIQRGGRAGLRGYAGGLEIKHGLLEHERRVAGSPRLGGNLFDIQTSSVHVADSGAAAEE